MLCKRRVVGFVVLLLCVDSAALGQTLDCMHDYWGYGNPSVPSQEGEGAHREAYQPIGDPPPVTPYMIEDVTVVIAASDSGGPMNLIGRQVWLRGLFGTYDPVTDPVNGFIPDPSEETYEHLFTIDATMLAPASEPDPPIDGIWEFSLPDTGHVFPASKRLNLGVVGVFDWNVNEELFSVRVSANCPDLPDGWVRFIPSSIYHSWIIDLAGMVNGHVIAITYNIVPVEGIPAVSNWGLVAMVLLTLTAGTLVYARRSSGRCAA